MWNKNIFLLWQGQLVSALGDMVYEIALGFWVLAYTGSTGVMGAVMAAGILPRSILGPFAGVLVDRANRKYLLVAMDTIRGIAVLIVAVAAIRDTLGIPLIIGAAVVIGLCAAFFDPAVTSSIPSLTKKENLVRVNSLFAINQTGAGILGNSLGGVLFVAFGAPLLFLANGISYLISAFTELFITIPPVKQESSDFNFVADMKAGFRFVRDHQGLIVLGISVFMLNFFLTIGGILYLPYFDARADLGPEAFGVTMAVLSATSLVGFALLSTVKLPPKFNFIWFAVNVIVFVVCRTSLFQVRAWSIMLVQFAFMGFSVAQVNGLIGAAGQLMVPENLRGKVFGLMGAVSSGLIPLGMALGGILAEFFSIEVIQLSTGLIAAVGFLPSLFNGEFQKMIRQEIVDGQAEDQTE